MVSSRNLHAKSHNNQGHSNAGKKKKKNKKDKNVLSEFTTEGGEDSDDFDTSSVSPSALSGDGEVVGGFCFSSAHSREQRLYYLLAVTRSRPTEVPTRQGVDVASVFREGGCHAVVFVETIICAQELIAELKALSLTAFAVHERTTKAQVLLLLLYWTLQTVLFHGQ